MVYFSRRLYGCFAIAMALLLVFLSPAQAAPVIRDDAELFSAPCEAQAKEIMSQIESTMGQPVWIETYRKLPAEYQNLPSANEKFGAWHRDRMRQTSHKGVLVLVCTDPRRIEFGYDNVTGSLYNLPEKAARIRAAFTADFKENRFDAGLIAGMSKLRELTVTPLAGTAQSQAANASETRQGDSVGGTGNSQNTTVYNPPSTYSPSTYTPPPVGVNNQNSYPFPSGFTPGPGPSAIMCPACGFAGFAIFFVFVVFTAIVRGVAQAGQSGQSRRRWGNDFYTGVGAGMMGSMLSDSSSSSFSSSDSSSSFSSSSSDSSSSFSSSSDSGSSASSDSGSSSSGNSF